MRRFTVTDGERETRGATVEDARTLGYSGEHIVASLRTDAATRLRRAVEGYRRRITELEAGVENPGPALIGIWGAKARLARQYRDDPDAMPDTAPGYFRSRLTAEAEAKGRTLGELLAVIADKADAFEGLGLLIDMMQAAAEAGMATVTDEAALAGGFEAYLVEAQVTADDAFREALDDIGAAG